MNIKLTNIIRSLMLALPVFLFSCSDKENLNPATSAIYPSSVELVVPSEKQVYLYTDDNSTTVFPMIAGDTLDLDYMLSPDSATIKDITWTSSDKEVASVDENGIVTAISSGTTVITVAPSTSYSGSGIYSTLKIIVYNSLDNATSITLSNTSDSIFEGETTTITPTIMPSTATYRSVIFSSSDDSIATVTNKGVVTGITGSVDGQKVTITATALDNSGITVSKELTVFRVVQPESVTLDQTYSANNYDWAIADKTYTLSYTTVPTSCTKTKIEWTSSDESIATVANGIVTFNQSGVFGNVTITATCPETGNSDQITLNLAEGLIRELFHDEDNITWDLTATHKSNGGTSTWSYGKLAVTTYTVSSTAQRGDFAKTDSYIWLNTGNYPIFAVKMTDVKDDYASLGVTQRNITMDTKSTDASYSGTVGGGSNKWTTRYKCSDGSYVLIYDLSSLSFATGGVLPTTIEKFSTFQLKYADIKTISSHVTYNVYWVQTFASLSKVQSYIDSEGLTWTEE